MLTFPRPYGKAAKRQGTMELIIQLIAGAWVEMSPVRRWKNQSLGTLGKLDRRHRRRRAWRADPCDAAGWRGRRCRGGGGLDIASIIQSVVSAAWAVVS